MISILKPSNGFSLRRIYQIVGYYGDLIYYWDCDTNEIGVAYEWSCPAIGWPD